VAYNIQSFIKHFIETYEGGLSLDPKDTGNWFGGTKVGSKYGVTGNALAAYRGVSKITAADIANLSIDEAVNIGVKLYYKNPNFDLLPFDPVIASVIDMGWGAGPGQAIKLLQRIIGADDDGKIGQGTADAYKAYLQSHSLEQVAKAYQTARYNFYDQIARKNPDNLKFVKGWRNRTDGFMPGTPFWKAFYA